MSAKTAFASQSRRMYDASSAVMCQLIGVRRTPQRCAPCITSTNSGRFEHSSATLSPGARPAARSVRGIWFARALSCANGRVPWVEMMATASGCNSATGPVAGGGAPGTVTGPGDTTVGGSTAGGAAAPGSNGTGSSAAVNGPKDMSRFDKNGKQLGVIFAMPPCQPVWHGGNNGGATMRGVTATEIKYVYFEPQGNAEVNAILARENLAASAEQRCEATQALHHHRN